MPENNTYALWIIPESAAYTLTDEYIARLSNAYNLPRFEPHVTVLGGIRTPESSAMRALAASLAPFWIRLANKVEYLDEFFRCLFLPARQTVELMGAFSLANRLFGKEGKPYYPHLSLAYGDLPVETKLKMIRELGEISKITFEAQAIALVQASIEIPISSWKVVERCPLLHS